MDNAYSHRFNANGTIDSICHQCFQTIAKVTHEADLDRIEQMHCCSPGDKLRLDVLAEEAKLSR